MTAPPTPSPIIRPLAAAGLRLRIVGEPLAGPLRWPAAPRVRRSGEMSSVRSAIAVACCSRFNSVGALRIPPPSWTARAAAAEIWNGMSRSTARGSTGWPAASSSARRQPAAHTGLGQRPLVDQQRIQRGADAADVVLGRGVRHGRRERQHDVALDAYPHAAGVVDRQRDTRAVGGLGGGGQRLDRPRRRRSATARSRPPRRAIRRGSTRRPPGRPSRCGDVEDAGDAGHVDAAELAGCATGSPAARSSDSVAVRVDEGQRDLPVQRGVQRLPELQVRRPAVEDQQSVAAAADDGARDEVDVLVGGRRLDGRLARHVERQ